MSPGYPTCGFSHLLSQEPALLSAMFLHMAQIVWFHYSSYAVTFSLYNPAPGFPTTITSLKALPLCGKKARPGSHPG